MAARDRAIALIISDATPMAEASRIVDLLGRKGLIRDWEPAAAAAPDPVVQPPEPSEVEPDLEVGPEGQTRYRLTYELSVCGFAANQPMPVLEGTWEEIVEQLLERAGAHRAAVKAAYQQHGDHRTFCPRLGNGFPKDNPEINEVTRCTVSEMLTTTSDGVRRIAGNSMFHQVFQKVADGFYDSPASTVSYLLNLNPDPWRDRGMTP